MTNRPDWRERAENMTRAIEDLQVPGHPPRGGRGTPDHQRVFQRYEVQLHEAADAARAWWDMLIEVESERAFDREAAADTVQERHPGGSVSHKTVIAVIRSAWLACADVNARVAAGDGVRPEELVLAWLVHAHREDLAEFLSDLAYWPIGLDRDGQWV
jgi:hypothetical protein